eukprot:TRINITY_DN9606_c0_g1_i1.p1 TRINITY_DN9606_c0_g1~~TRINITY_DN9606_c0_g1_i1.p1  ORF type:complete len:302 (+),score=27.74 TRINITY_DN9606_c0_g1_i1:407-1312(+)
MGGCVSTHTDVDGNKRKCYGCVPRWKNGPVRNNKDRIPNMKKGRGTTITPITRAPEEPKKNEIEAFSHPSPELTINNCVSQCTEKSVITHSEPEVGMVNFHCAEKSHSPKLSSANSKDERFYDSVAFLNSDTEDEFMSVSGDTLTSTCDTWDRSSSAPRTPRPSATALKERMAKDENWNEYQLISVQIPEKKKLRDFLMERLSTDGEGIEFINPILDSAGTYEAECCVLTYGDTKYITQGSTELKLFADSNVESDNRMSPCKEGHIPQRCSNHTWTENHHPTAIADLKLERPKLDRNQALV